MTCSNESNNFHVDKRGHEWLQKSISVELSKELELVRKEWAWVTDEEIENAKQKITLIFDDDEKWKSVKGQACSDFIYLFGDDGKSHYFVATNESKQPIAIKVMGECDMTFSPSADFSLILMQRDIGM